MTSTAIMTDALPTTELAGLIDQALGGSREAYAELVRRHQRSVRMYLGRFVHSADDADDLAQEVFLAAFRGLEEFDPSAPFGPWLMGIARNRALQHLRSELRRRRREANGVQIALAECRVQQAEERDAERDRSESDALRECLEKLPHNSRRLVDEHYLSGRTAADIARERNATAGAIRMMLLRIRRALADCMRRRLDLRETPT
jgi:RNA polymerase sigma-70 factor, ECF subfamily